MTRWDPLAARSDQWPAYPVQSSDSRMWDFRSINPYAPDNFDLLARDRHDGLDQRRVTGCAKPTAEIAAFARFVDKSGAWQADEHHVSNGGIPVPWQDSPKSDRFARSRVDAKPANGAGENGEQY